MIPGRTGRCERGRTPAQPLYRQLRLEVVWEGPGHVSLDEIAANIVPEKHMSGDAPYDVLGLILTDSGAGYDHVTAAIGAASSARHDADLICHIIPAGVHRKVLRAGIKSALTQLVIKSNRNVFMIIAIYVIVRW